MKRFFLFIVFFLIFPASSAFSLFIQVEGVEDAQIKRVAISNFNSSLIYVASNNSLYKSQDKGKTFKKVSVFKDESVQHIFFDQHLANTLYIVTSRHLYRMESRLEQLYSSPEEKIIYTAAKHKGTIYLGTSQGLYLASEDVLYWRKSNAFGDFAIYYIEPVEKSIYFATAKGVYLFKSEDNIKRVFITRQAEEEEGEGLRLKIIKADIFDAQRIWLGTNQGLFVSLDEGKTWKKLYIEGVDSLYINCIAQTNLEKGTLYLATSKGFFKADIKTKSAREIYEGLNTPQINWVEFSPKGKIYLATYKGLFGNDYFTSSYESKSLEAILRDGPSIQEIQQAALSYNEVYPDKIRKWRRDAMRRAWLPKFKVGMDGDKDEQYHWASTSRDNYYLVAQGPDEKGFGWDVSLEWDLADLVWNPSQTSIDTRSKLNTQLRLDILGEINRVYFERLRLKREIADSSLSEEDLFKKKLRLEELTAIIDGYSGGYFSERIKELNE